MIIGNGMLARAFKDTNLSKDTILFASGVSNSVETRISEFDREKALLKQTIQNHPDKKLIYFSTCSINDAAVKDRMYVKHKLLMENHIAENCAKYLICRISNVVGKNGNPHTLINYLYNCITQGIPFEAWVNSERNIIDVDDLVYYVLKLDELKVYNQTINIANHKSYKVLDIIAAIEKYCKVDGIYKRLDKGVSLDIDTTVLNSFVKENSPAFNSVDEYITVLMKKYFDRA